MAALRDERYPSSPVFAMDEQRAPHFCGVLQKRVGCCVSRTRSIRARDNQWVSWALAAEARNMSLNAWLCAAGDLVAERDLAERRRVDAETRERDRARAVMRGELWAG